MATDLEKAFTALAAKADVYAKYYNYFDGDQPLRYSTKRLRQVFEQQDVKFIENWCSVVINASLDRLDLVGFNVTTSDQDRVRLTELWQATQMDLDADDVHTAALVAGEGYVIAWRNADQEIEAYYNDPRNVHIFYKPDHPREKSWACKWWVNEDGKRRIRLYYPDRLELYVSSSKATETTSAASMSPLDEESGANPYGVIPIFHFRPERRRIKSELDNCIPLQDAVNKLLNDMVVAAEFGAFPKRWAIGNFELEGKIPSGPDSLTQFPGADIKTAQATQVGQWQTAELGNYLNAMDKLSSAMGIISRTPRHYFYSQAGDPSGEALLTMEAPLNKKVQRFITRFNPVYRELAAFLLKLDGRNVPATAIEPQWEEVRSMQPLTQAQVRQTNAGAGMPLKTILRDEGWTKEELDQLEQDKAPAVGTAPGVNKEAATKAAAAGIRTTMEDWQKQLMMTVQSDPKFAADLQKLYQASASARGN